MLRSVYLKFRCGWCPTLSMLSLAPLEKAVFRVFNGTRREGDVPLLRLCPAVLPRAGLPRQGQNPAGRQLQDRGAHLPDAPSPSKHGQDANLQTPHPPLTPALPGPRGWRLGVPIQKPGYRQCRDAQTWGGPGLPWMNRHRTQRSLSTLQEPKHGRVWGVAVCQVPCQVHRQA